MSGSAGTLLAQIDAFAQAARARDLVAEESLRALTAALHAARTGGIDRPIDPLLVVMLCGPTAVGKSSLLNALAGAAISPAGLGATTDAPLVYLHAAEDPARLFAYGQTLGEMARGTVSVVRHTSAALREKVVVDTPDIDSAVRTHRATTEAAVANADIVLFVTSPEKYKVEEPLHWLAAHRRRHGIAFVLNKWDADGMGMQFAQRQRVAEDFRALLTGFGFADPLVFLVSSRAAADSDGASGFAALRRWLEEQLDASTAVAVSARARRGNWGELAAALNQSVATLAGTREDIDEITRIWNGAAATARGMVQADAARLAETHAPAAWRPASPGLFGLALSALSRRRDATPHEATGGTAFGADALAAMQRAGSELELFARTHRLRANGAASGCATELERLAQDFAATPARARADIVASGRRAWLRRGLAWLWVSAVELLITAVLALTLWRLANDFIVGRYEPFALLGSAAAIVVLLALFGQAGLRLLFPAPAKRVAAAARSRAIRSLDAATVALTGATSGQIEAALRLRETGTTLLADIDRQISALTAQADDDAAARLFADAPAGATARFE